MKEKKNPLQNWEREREREREREPFFLREKYVKNGRENDKFLVRGCE